MLRLSWATCVAIFGNAFTYKPEQGNGDTAR